jgi:SRSO17 transposase
VPDEVAFATKPQIAAAQVREARHSGAPDGVVLADAGYGNDNAFRDATSEAGLTYAVGIQSSTRDGLPAQHRCPWSHQPVSRDDPASCCAGRPGTNPYRSKRWRSALMHHAIASSRGAKARGTRAALKSRFAAVRIRASHRDYWRATQRDEEWLLVEWPEGEPEPAKYWLSTIVDTVSLQRLVHIAKMRWRIERDYQDLKQEFGLGHFEGRGWRGFHHHASLCIAAYGFLVAQRLTRGGGKKTPRSAASLPYPKITCREVLQRAQRHVPDSIASLRWCIAAYIAQRLRRCPFCSSRYYL